MADIKTMTQELTEMSADIEKAMVGGDYQEVVDILKKIVEKNWWDSKCTKCIMKYIYRNIDSGTVILINNDNVPKGEGTIPYTNVF